MKPYISAFLFAFIFTQGIAKPEGQPEWMLQYKPIPIEGRFAAYMGPSPLILDSELRKQTPGTYKEAIQLFGPAFIHSLSGSGSWEWHFSDGKALRSPGPYGGTLSDAFHADLFDSALGSIQLQNKK